MANWYWKAVRRFVWERFGVIFSAVWLQTGEVEWMDVEGNSNSGTSVAFPVQLRGRHGGRLNVISENAPAHRGEALREYLRTAGPEPAPGEPAGVQPGLQRRWGQLGLG